jgi:hypothetical protein
VTLKVILEEIDQLKLISGWHWGNGQAPSDKVIEKAKAAALSFWERGFTKIDSFLTLDGKIELIVGFSVQIIE